MKGLEGPVSRLFLPLGRTNLTHWTTYVRKNQSHTLDNLRQEEPVSHTGQFTLGRTSLTHCTTYVRKNQSHTLDNLRQEEPISHTGQLTSYTARNWTVFCSVEHDIYFPILRKRMCICCSLERPFSSPISLESKGERQSCFLLSYICILFSVPLQCLLWRKLWLWIIY
jgi:hypothetical protein